MTFNSTTEAWRPTIQAYAGDLPIEFLMAWIQRESNGCPCSWTVLSEAGIFQLEPPDNIAVAGSSLAALHPIPPCTAGTQGGGSTGIPVKWFSDLSPDQANEQVRAGIQYVNYARNWVHQALTANGGQDWDEGTTDFWSMVKYYHNLPGTIAAGLAAAMVGLGRPAATWAEFRSYVTYKGVPPTKWLDYAEWIGSYAGDGSGPSPWIVLQNIVIDATDPVSSPPTPPLSAFDIALGVAGLVAGGLAAYYVSKRYLHAP